MQLHTFRRLLLVDDAVGIGLPLFDFQFFFRLVPSIVDSRAVRWYITLTCNLVPVDTFEELMVHDCFDLDSHVGVGH